MRSELGELNPSAAVPAPRIAESGAADAPKQRNAAIRAVVCHSVSATGLRSRIMLLGPILAIELPCILERQPAAVAATAKQHGPVPAAIESHGMQNARRWARIGKLGPILAVPSPHITLESRPILSAEQERHLPGAVIYDRVGTARARTNIVHLSPI